MRESKSEQILSAKLIRPHKIVDSVSFHPERDRVLVTFAVFNHPTNPPYDLLPFGPSGQEIVSTIANFVGNPGYLILDSISQLN